MARRHLPDMLVGKLLMLMMASLLARAALGLRVVVDVLVNLALRRLAGVIDWSSNGEKDVRRRHIGRGRRNGDRAGEARCRGRAVWVVIETVLARGDALGAVGDRDGEVGRGLVRYVGCECRVVIVVVLVHADALDVRGAVLLDGVGCVSERQGSLLLAWEHRIGGRRRDVGKGHVVLTGDSAILLARDRRRKARECVE